MKTHAIITVLAVAGIAVAGVGPSAVLAQSPPAKAGDVCDYIAKQFSGPVGAWYDVTRRVYDGLMIDRGHIDLDGDGKGEDVWITSQGSGHFAYVAIGRYEDYEETRKAIGAAHRNADAHEAHFLPHGGRWYVVEMNARSPGVPAYVLRYTPTEIQMACTFAHTEVEAVVPLGAPAALKDVACNDFANATLLQPDKSDKITDADMAALKAAEPLSAEWQPGAARGCCTLKAEGVYHADLDNTGKPSRLARVTYGSGAGPGCSSAQWRLLPDAGSTTINTDKYLALLKRQGIDPKTVSNWSDGCKQDFNLRQVKGRTALERNQGTMGGLYSLWTPEGTLACTKQMTTTITVSNRGDTK